MTATSSRYAGAVHGTCLLTTCVLSGACSTSAPGTDGFAPARRHDCVLTTDQTHMKFSRRIAPKIL
jgi:hypothetical protein